MRVFGELIFNDKYFPIIKSGKKTTTIRQGIRDYTAGIYKAFNVDKTMYILVEITKTEITNFGSLTEHNAETDGFESLAQLKEDLLKYYPDLVDDSPMTIVTIKTVHLVEKYRKKPVVIEAIQWDGLNLSEVKEFCNEAIRIEIYDAGWKAGVVGAKADIFIDTLEGTEHASVGDYIIKGVDGEFYPCKPDIFEKTYEKVIDND